MNPPRLDILAIVATTDRDTGLLEAMVMGAFYYGRPEPVGICTRGHSVECALSTLYARAAEAQWCIAVRWN